MGFSPAQQALVQRWDGFLAKIEERHTGLLNEAAEGVAGMIAADPSKAAPIHAAIGGVKARLGALRKKIDETWEKQVDDQFVELSTGFSRPNFHDVGIYKMQDAGWRMDDAWSRAAARWSADIYRAMWPLAQAAMDVPLNCTQCASPLDGGPRLRPEHRTCRNCGATNQVFPEPIVTEYLTGAHSLAEEASMEQRIAIERFRNQVDRERGESRWPSEPVESLDRWEAMEREYWEIYGRTRRSITQETETSIREFVESRMGAFRQYSLMTIQHWRRAKGL